MANHIKIPHDTYVKDKLKKNLYAFINHESFSGILIFFCVIFAMLIANSQFSHTYFEFQELKIGVFWGESQYGMTILHAINDVAMSLFFLMIGLETKREILYGELVGFKKIAFPVLGAIGGIIMPIVIYLAFNHDTPSAGGFGVAMSTDTAFALGAILLLGKRVPLSLKIFLVTLAVIDDLGAILVIVFFYTSSLNAFWLVIAGIIIAILLYYNYQDKHRLAAYLILGIFLWIAIYNSGIHATIAAVIVAFSIPGRSNVSDHYLTNLKNELNKIDILIKNGSNFFETHIQKQQKNIFKEWIYDLGNFFKSDQNLTKKFNIKEQSKRAQLLDSISKYSAYAQNPLIQVQTFLHPVCSYFVIPVFAFVNAGVKLDSNIDFSLDHIFLGTVLGLVLGKPIGILLFVLIGEKCKIATKPKDLTYAHIFATSCLAGIGFTMSIFVANLAYNNQNAINLAKISILYASSIALIVGISALYLSTKPTKNQDTQELAESTPQKP
ncbi:Na+/H+ antiporter NhaA [uncultured Helicobacter sp.]|uniref:Na+/H+ antiporter NhaA n=1 Tax=uncultured Helicobacter sp. TaxID=175537 RepID=UPI0025996DB3|nr:Na+/H+ antiporter NhaA [uncultured Helicobacter sp.]